MSFMDRNWTINFFFLYSIPYWTLEIQQMPFSIDWLNSFGFFIHQALIIIIFKSKWEKEATKKEKEKVLPAENQIMIIMFQCG